MTFFRGTHASVCQTPCVCFVCMGVFANIMVMLEYSVRLDLDFSLVFCSCLQIYRICCFNTVLMAYNFFLVLFLLENIFVLLELNILLIVSLTDFWIFLWCFVLVCKY